MKNYLLRFGQNNPANYTGLSPTFTVFAFLPSGTLTTPPGITESPAGTGCIPSAGPRRRSRLLLSAMAAQRFRLRIALSSGF
jgi:hypothetical protein